MNYSLNMPLKSMCKSPPQKKRKKEEEEKAVNTKKILWT
jgi:hypothetical protein